MKEPQQVTGPGGAIRWVASDGRSFGTKQEAAAASAWTEITETAPALAAKPPRSRLPAFLLYGGMSLLFGWLTVVCVQTTLNGGWHFKQEWGWLSVPFGIFFCAGATLTGAVGLFAVASKRDDINPGAVFDWWVNKLGCGILWLIGGLIALAVGWYFLSDIFKGVSKGTGIVIVLLFMILVALSQIAENGRRE